MQRERRRDVYPWTWEPWAAAGLGVVLGIALGVQVGRGLANLFAGTGWTWPETDTGGAVSSPLGTAFWTSLPGVVTGHADAGLSPPVPADVASSGLLWFSVGLVELTLCGAVGWICARLYRRWGPDRMRGMASGPEAEKTLGVTRLRAIAPIVRPDRYGKHPSSGMPAHRGTSEADRPGAGPGGHHLRPWLRERRSAREPW